MKNKKLYGILFLFLFTGWYTRAEIALPKIPSKQFVITDFGASTASADNTACIQKAIDKCAAGGGGVVIVPKGVFLCGPLNLLDKTELHLAEGCVLKMLPYGHGDGTRPGTYPNAGKPGVYPSFISGKDVSNIRVSGRGTIDGQGADWWSAYRAIKGTAIVMKRGCLIAFNGCRYAEINGIKLINAPNVHIAIGKKSSDVTIDGITIDTPSDAPNSDGIDTWAPNIVIKNSSISCGDDNIAMDSETQHITIKKCTFGTGHGCSIGSFTHNVKHVLVDSCTFKGTTSAIRMKSNRNRGGGETDITYSNLTISNVRWPISIESYYPKVPKSPEDDTAQAVSDKTPSWSNITFRNIRIVNCESAGVIWGLPELSVTNVLFDNVQINAQKSMVLNNAKNVEFKNSTMNVSGGDAIVTYRCSPTGIDLSSGKPVLKK